MKTLSIILTIILGFAVINLSLHIFELYDSKGALKVFGFTNKEIAPLAMPYIILFMLYSIALIFAVILNFRKKYSLNTSFSGTMIVASWFLPLLLNNHYFYNFFIGLTWLK